ncbi:hypothetical protein DFH09DRAFT_1127029 [Mycena vulgaris]|nr:hypothetical protein DFH09DRAFT_1127029 [Mycena vulgaris]
MHPLQFRRIAIGFYFLSYFGTSRAAAISIVPKSAVVKSGPEPTTFAVLEVTGPLLTTITTTFTTSTPVVTTDVSGRTTTSNLVFISTAVTLAPVPTGQSSSTQAPSSINPQIVAAFVGAGALVLGAFLGLCLRRRALRSGAKYPQGISNPDHSEVIGASCDSTSGLNRASWAPYIARAQSTGRTLSNTTTHQLYIANQLNRAREKEMEIPAGNQESVEEIVNPFHSSAEFDRGSWEPYIQSPASTLDGDIASTRQMYISNQVNRMREKVLELEEMSTLLHSTSHSSGDSSATLHASTTSVRSSVIGVELTDNPRDPESLELQHKLEEAIQQIEALNARINEFERQRRSSWALGRSNEPPPGYTE